MISSHYNFLFCSQEAFNRSRKVLVLHFFSLLKAENEMCKFLSPVVRLTQLDIVSLKDVTYYFQRNVKLCKVEL